VCHPEGHEATVAISDGDNALDSETFEHSLEAIRLEYLSTLGAGGGGVPEEYEVGDKEVELLEETTDLLIPSDHAVGPETMNQKERRPLLIAAWRIL
jgi:hypothetical protein